MNVGMRVRKIMLLNEIKSNVKDVISYSQGIEDPKVDELIDNWYQAKKNIIALFGDKLIYTFPEKVVFHLDEKQIDKERVRG